MLRHLTGTTFSAFVPPAHLHLWQRWVSRCFLVVGLMVTSIAKPVLLAYNCRFSFFSEGHNARWKTRLRFDVDTSGDVGMWTTSEKRTNGHEKRSAVLNEEMNSFRGSERNLSDDSRRNSPSPAVSGAQSDSDRRSVLSSVESESSDRYDEEEDVLPTTSKPTERSKQATRCKHQGESDVEKPRTYRRKRSRTSSSRFSRMFSKQRLRLFA